MWINQRNQSAAAPSSARPGTVTVSGTRPAVFSGGEQRDLPLLAPGGIVWCPDVGTEVMLLSGGSDELPCVAGVACSDPPAALEPGELLLYSKGASLCLRNDGTIEVRGTLIAIEDKEDKE